MLPVTRPVCTTKQLADPVNGMVIGDEGPVITGISGKPSVTKRKQNMPWFAGRGYSQILAGYYDGPPQTIRTWLDASASTTGVLGVMYNTWRNSYDDLEAFGRAAWK